MEDSGSGVAPRRRRQRRRRRRGWGTRCRDHRTTRSRSAGRHAPWQSRRFLPTFARCLTECSSKQTSMPLQSWQHIGQSPPCPVGPSWQCTAKADLDGRDDGRVEQQHPARHEHPCRDARAIGGHTRPAFRNDLKRIGPRSKRDRNILLIRARAPCMKRDCGWMSLPSARTQASVRAGPLALRVRIYAVQEVRRLPLFTTAKRACAQSGRTPPHSAQHGRVHRPTPERAPMRLGPVRQALAAELQTRPGSSCTASIAAGIRRKPGSSQVRLESRAPRVGPTRSDPVGRRTDTTRTARAARAHPGRDHHQGAGRAGARERAGHRLPCLPTRPFGGPMPKMHSSQVSRSCSMPRRCRSRSWSIASLSRSCARRVPAAPGGQENSPGKTARGDGHERSPPAGGDAGTAARRSWLARRCRAPTLRFVDLEAARRQPVAFLFFSRYQSGAVSFCAQCNLRSQCFCDLAVSVVVGANCPLSLHAFQ